MELTDQYETISPECCDAPFAVQEKVYRRWLRTKEWWHCPHCGSRRHFVGESQENKRIRELEQRLSQTQVRAVEAEGLARTRQRQYERIRDRVKNGVCPCCNRTFQNVARHMATKHPEFGERGIFKQVRLAFGLTQAEAADECGLSATTISHYENGAHVSERTREVVESWIQAAKQP